MIITFTFSCKSQQGSIVQLSTPFIEILSNSDKSINELSAKSKDNDLNLKLNAIFQSLSENNNVFYNISPVNQKPEILIERSSTFLLNGNQTTNYYVEEICEEQE